MNARKAIDQQRRADIQAIPPSTTRKVLSSSALVSSPTNQHGPHPCTTQQQLTMTGVMLGPTKNWQYLMTSNKRSSKVVHFTIPLTTKSLSLRPMPQTMVGAPCFIKSERTKSSSLLPSWDANSPMQPLSGILIKRSATQNMQVWRHMKTTSMADGSMSIMITRISCSLLPPEPRVLQEVC